MPHRVAPPPLGASASSTSSTSSPPSVSTLSGLVSLGARPSSVIGVVDIPGIAPSSGAPLALSPNLRARPAISRRRAARSSPVRRSPAALAASCQSGASPPDCRLRALPDFQRRRRFRGDRARGRRRSRSAGYLVAVRLLRRDRSVGAELRRGAIADAAVGSASAVSARSRGAAVRRTRLGPRRGGSAVPPPGGCPGGTARGGDLPGRRRLLLSRFAVRFVAASIVLGLALRHLHRLRQGDGKRYAGILSAAAHCRGRDRRCRPTARADRPAAGR